MVAAVERGKDRLQPAHDAAWMAAVLVPERVDVAAADDRRTNAVL
jgi:hypothetical protein